MIIGRYVWGALVVYNCKARPNPKRKKVVQRKNCREVGRYLYTIAKGRVSGTSKKDSPEAEVAH
jgi:hypothetical protein